MNTLFGPSMKVSAWFEDRPQKLHTALVLLPAVLFPIGIFLNFARPGTGIYVAG